MYKILTMPWSTDFASYFVSKHEFTCCVKHYKGTWPALCYALLEICITKPEIYWNINEINHEPFW